MANPKKTYFFPSTWDYAPDGPIQLGNIITSPAFPDQSMNKPLPPETYPEMYKYEVTWSPEKHRSGRYGVWLGFLSILGLGVDASFHHERMETDTFEFERMSTVELRPTQQYVEQAMASDAVVKYLEKVRFKKSLYMITAIKIVYGAKGKSQRLKGGGGDLGVKLDGTLTGAPMSLGPKVEGERKTNIVHEFKGSSDFVFAFRVNKVVLHHDGSIGHSPFTKRAMYDAEGKQLQAAVPFCVEGLAAEDAPTDEFSPIQALDATDDDGSTCVCATVRL